MFKTTRHQGNAGVAAALAYYTSQGYSVSLPFGDATRYDLIVDIDNTLHRVQCKTAFGKSPNGNYQAELRTAGGNQSWTGKTSYISSSEIESVIVLDGDGGLWEFPAELLESRRSVTMCSKYGDRKVK